MENSTNDADATAKKMKLKDKIVCLFYHTNPSPIQMTIMNNMRGKQLRICELEALTGIARSSINTNLELLIDEGKAKREERDEANHTGYVFSLTALGDDGCNFNDKFDVFLKINETQLQRINSGMFSK